MAPRQHGPYRAFGATSVQRRWAPQLRLLVISIPVAEFVYFAIGGDEACSRGDSDFGVSSWWWIPPGHVCRYDGPEGTAETVGPSAFTSLYMVAALVFVLLLVVRRRRAAGSLIHE